MASRRGEFLSARDRRGQAVTKKLRKKLTGGAQSKARDRRGLKARPIQATYGTSELVP